jgi:hypothetical protein
MEIGCVHGRTLARSRDTIVTRASILLAEDFKPSAGRTKPRRRCLSLPPHAHIPGPDSSPGCAWCCKVRGGIVEVASRSLFVSSTRGSGNMTRQFSLPDGIPAIVGRNGTVKVHGDSASDEVRFEATFKRNGTVKGYLSLWYTQLGLSGEGKLRADQYLGASNWTAKRVGPRAS